MAGIIPGRFQNRQETMNIAMLSYHTCPLATLGGKHTGGMNVYVRELTRHLGALGVHVDVFTRSQDEHVPHVLHDLGCGNRVVHIPAGPESPTSKNDLPRYIPEFTEGILQFAREQGYPLRLDPQPLLDVRSGSRVASIRPGMCRWCKCSTPWD